MNQKLILNDKVPLMVKYRRKTKRMTLLYYCGECTEGEVKLKLVEGAHFNQVTVKKCNKCGFQYYFKQCYLLQPKKQ